MQTRPSSHLLCSSHILLLSRLRRSESKPKKSQKLWKGQMHFQWADRQLRLAVPVVTIWGQVGCQVEMRSHMVYSPATGPWLYLMTQWDPHIHTHILAGTGILQECSHSAEGRRKSVRMKLHYRAMRWCNYHRVGSFWDKKDNLEKKDNLQLFSSCWEILIHIKMGYHAGFYLFIHSSVSNLHLLYSSPHCCWLEWPQQAK